MRRYQKVMRIIQQQVDAGALTPGSRVPSVREMCAQTGFSAVTVHHAYVQLEGEGVLEARPRSGFYVANDIRKLGDFALDGSDMSGGESYPPSRRRAILELAFGRRPAGRHGFGSVHIDEGLLPRREFDAHYLKTMRQRLHSRDHGERDGAIKLREAIAKRVALRGGAVRAQEVLVTSGPYASLDLCLEASTSPGDVVLIESPSHPALVFLLQKRQLQTIEIYSHPSYGIDPDQFDYLMDRNPVHACVVMPTHHVPTGVSYSEQTLERIAAKAASKDAVIIENDAYGDLAHGSGMQRTVLAMEGPGTVLQIGSFDEVLGPGYGLGWIAARNANSDLRDLVLFNGPPPCADALQSALADFVSKRNYERYLRDLRANLAFGVRRGLDLISRQFPEGCAVSRPDGGFMCWIRAPIGFDALEALPRAETLGVGYLPGPIFSVTNSFRNFLALNLAQEWNANQIEKLATLASLLHASA